LCKVYWQTDKTNLGLRNMVGYKIFLKSRFFLISNARNTLKKHRFEKWKMKQWKCFISYDCDYLYKHFNAWKGQYGKLFWKNWQKARLGVLHQIWESFSFELNIYQGLKIFLKSNNLWTKSFVVGAIFLKLRFFDPS